MKKTKKSRTDENSLGQGSDHPQKKAKENEGDENGLVKSSDQPQVKAATMRHAQRYQKNRKKKQLLLKKSLKEEAKQKNSEDQKTSEQNTGESPQKKKLSPKKTEMSVSKTPPSKKSKVSEVCTNSTKAGADNKVMMKKKKDGQNEQSVAKPAVKKSKNKYKHLAGKGKVLKGKVLNVLSGLHNGTKPYGESKPGTQMQDNMDIDSDSDKMAVTKSSLKRKLETAEDVIVKKKAKLKPAGSGSNEDLSSIRQEECNETVKSENLERKKRKKKKSKDKVSKDVSCVEKLHGSASEITEDMKDNTILTSSPEIMKSTKKSSLKVDKIRSLLQAKASESSKPQTSPEVTSKKSASHTSPEETSKKSRKLAPLSLKERLEEQLKAARFRYLNEQLYTGDSKSAQELFAEDPGAFEVYHHGYQAQVSKWPANPVDRVISYVKDKPEKLIIADFGCGDAKLAQSVPNKVHSFDLVAVNEHITVADSADVPLPDRSVDIAVFSLSLMGTNFVEFLIEASRVLKLSGTLLIAEVVSRFEKVRKFIKKLEKLGFTVINMDKSNKMFIWFEFSKKSEITNKTPIPEMELLPCIYKKR